MKNQLKQVENNLRYIAKRNKSITFSLGLALTYLMLGINAFSQDIATTSINKEEIAMTAEKLSENLRNIKRENEKRLKGSRLELIQLMEQGNQVVKSPWASWQFGINFMYNNWGGSYKGKGDKAEKYPFEGIFTRSNDIFERSVSPLSQKYKELETATDSTSASSNRRIGLPWQYGITSTTRVQEKPAILFIGASIKPKDVSIGAVEAPSMNIQTPQAPNLNIPELVWPSLEVPTPDSPSFSVNIPVIDVNPITDYSFQHRSNTGIRWTEVKEIDGLAMNIGLVIIRRQESQRGLQDTGMIRIIKNYKK